MAISPNTCWEVDAANGSDSNGGGFVAGSSGTDKTYNAGSTPPAGVSRTDLALTAIGAPASAPTVTASGTGGTVAAGTYSVVVTYLSYYGTAGAETLPSAAASVTVTSGQDIVVTSPPAAVGANFYKVYISAVGTTTPLYLQNGATGTAIGTAYTQSAAISTAGATAPTADSSYVNVTSAGTPFAATDVGNTINVSAGTGWTTGFYQVMAFDATSGKATLDRSPTAGAAPGGNGTGVLGGALATTGKAQAGLVGSNTVFVRYAGAATYTTLGISTSVTPGAAAPPTRVVGYYRTRGDIYPLPAGGYSNQAYRPQFAPTSASPISCSGNGIALENLAIDNKGTAGSTTITLGAYGTARNCLVQNFGTNGISTGTNGAVVDCEVTGGLAGAVGVRVGAGVIVANCHVHDNACTGIYAGGSATIVDNLVVNNAGASSDGIQAGGSTTILRNTIRGNGRHGIYNLTANMYAQLWRDNILALNGGYGLYGASAAGVAATPAWDGNAYYSNTLGDRHYADDATTNPINGVAAYVNRLDVTLTGSPFLNDTGVTSTSNFGLNAAAGAACRGAGTPQTWPLASGAGGIAPTASAPCLGAAQSAAGGGGISKGRFLGGD